MVPAGSIDQPDIQGPLHGVDCLLDCAASFAVAVRVAVTVAAGEAGIWSAQMLLGVGVALAGFSMYSHCKLVEGGVGGGGSSPVIKGVPQLPPSLRSGVREVRESNFGSRVQHR